ncbi:phage Gp37/Gp68 family protein [Luteolibacter yonseiensis]|uniref:Phage Gp37/Gp68 family protein n=1 Tax=Luteolibacter yonseiensis TaxID=1144680 RepID=A0A934R5T6_9BACT|nr:phage Gp37/Gp68 family protein [Luteolibacter yonseiensis]MBK1816508.1 phage Gp37/Gp68 family protein [Luteolibacter yonseiensis]
MSENTSIEWTDHTFNPVRGCTMVSPGCAHCYAAREAVRFPGIRGVWGDSGTRILAVPDAWKAPVKWNRKAEAAGTRARVFCASLADIFEDWKGDLRFPADIAPDGWVTARWDGTQMVREFEASADAQGLPPATMDNMRTELFRLIEATPFLDWQLLTKRPENVMRMVPDHWRERFPANVWMGTTVENQEMADKRVPVLLNIPATVRFLSCEPLLGPVDLSGLYFSDVCGGRYPFKGVAPEHRTKRIDLLDWVIAGGESGPKARPMHPDWARSLRDQCQAAGVPFLFKQWGEHVTATIGNCYDGDSRQVELDGTDSSDWTIDRHTASTEIMVKIGKKKAGRLLDGREWNEFPTPSQP